MRVGLPFFRPAAPTFRHGVHPAQNKGATNGLRIERMPFVDEYVLPLAQHIGAPSKPLVTAGQTVQRGEKIADPGGFVSVALHSPVTGTVQGIEMRAHPGGSPQPAIVIRTDPYADQKWAPTEPPPDFRDVEDVTSRVQQAGIVGLGGAAFPAHVKLAVPEGRRVRAIILNGCECEPYLTCDHRVMIERPEAVLKGLHLLMDMAGAERGYVGIELNKSDAIETMEQLTRDDPRVEVIGVQVKYPEGAEKMLIEAVLSEQVPVGKIPLDRELIVNNVGTSAALADLFETGRPLIERVVTVTGPGIRRPANVQVPIGTPVRELIEHCGGLAPGTEQVILGGPMMGQAQASLDVPVMKGTSGVLAVLEAWEDAEEQPCIRCGRCLEACAMFLNPSRLAMLARAERADELVAHHVNACFECASCSYVCPSHIPLVQWIRVGKSLVRRESKK
ncbi:MAG: electron transport complex subunit RsxC [Myxococcota bacterium]